MDRLHGLVSAKASSRPGSTPSDHDGRDGNGDLGGTPKVTLSELKRCITAWVTEGPNVEPKSHRGDMHEGHETPEALWLERIALVERLPPPSEDTFIALLEQSRRLHVSAKGIRWDDLQDQSEALDAIRRHPKHREGPGDHGGTCLVRRIPHDLGHVYVWHPHDSGRVLKVPATRQDYAKGLTAHQHAVMSKHGHEV